MQSALHICVHINMIAFMHSLMQNDIINYLKFMHDESECIFVKGFENQTNADVLRCIKIRISGFEFSLIKFVH